jgi:hypothetical protein
MKAPLLILFSLYITSVCVMSARSQSSFQNLGFEDVVIQDAPSGYVPFDAFDPIDANAALPFWTVLEDSSVCTAIWGAPQALDETSVALVSEGAPNQAGNSPLAGNYCIQMYAFADAPSGFFKTASISQTGFVPVGTKSIQFLISSPPVAGGQIEANPTITLNNIPIPIFQQSASGGILTMVGDVSAFADSTAQLDIQCIGTSGLPGTLSENIFNLDSISFSPSPVPEPNTKSLMVIGILIVLSSRKTKCATGLN